MADLEKMGAREWLIENGWGRRGKMPKCRCGHSKDEHFHPEPFVTVCSGGLRSGCKCREFRAPAEKEG